MILEVDPAQQARCISTLASLIRRHYLFADRADDLADQVQRWIANPDTAPAVVGGPGSGADSIEQVAASWTEALRSATGDLHFKVMARTFTTEEQNAAPQDRWKHSMPGPRSNFGFRSVSVVDGTAVITLDSLDHIAWSRQTVLATMAFARHAERVIIDVRRCQGGDPEVISLLAGHFLGPEPVELATVHWRDGRFETCHSTPVDTGDRFGPDVGLAVVIGPDTASGGEAVADHLQGPGRAVIVGLPSVGAAHRIKEFQICNGLVARIPSGRVVNAFTGTDWESTGVTPDLVVPTESDVLAAANGAAGDHRWDR